MLACAAAVLPAQQPPTAAAAPTAPAAPLAQYAAVKVAVVPVQFYRADSGFVQTSAPAMRAAFDSLVTAQMAEHGLSGVWASPTDVMRAARRNVMYEADPTNLGAFAVRRGVPKGGQIADPLAGNLRRLVALHDTRYALMPVELRAEGGREGGRLAVRVLLLDARLMGALFQVDVTTDGAASYSPAMLEQLARRVVELAVAP
ncbi:MAG: hypothetical protein H3C62_10060 [Gemmatimonadaceae bacterium]|nr:hypothetical protein [Gemmatimonadaceae bacterium]